MGGIYMNWDEVQGNWRQFKGKVKEQWGKLTDDELDRIDGRYDQLVGRIQEQYGITREAAEDQVRNFMRSTGRPVGQERAEPSARRAGGQKYP
jgi:uncharacterized protein YjbJ (UPF0337 family)